jgi:hypothetical protein
MSEKRRFTSSRRPRREPVTGWSIPGWCRYRGVGVSTFYVWEKNGRAPLVLRPAGAGGVGLITIEADAAWEAKLAAQAATEFST